MSEAATRQSDWVSPPGVAGTFNAPTTVAVTGGVSQAINLHATSTKVPAGYYITVNIVSGGPVHFFMAPDSSVAATTTNGLTLSAGQSGNFKLSALTKSTAGVDVYPHQYMMIYGDAAGVLEWYTSSPQAVI